MSAEHFNRYDTQHQRKAFAHTLDATSYILRRLNFPVHKLRDVVDALQGASGGRGGVDLFYSLPPPRLGHAGKGSTAGVYAARKVAALREAQSKTGRLLFTVVSGGQRYYDEQGQEKYKPMHYVDHLTGAANWMMQQACVSPLWKENPAKAIESFTEAAIEMLPKVEANEGSKAKDSKTDEEYISWAESYLLSIAEKLYMRVADK